MAFVLSSPEQTDVEEHLGDVVGWAYCSLLLIPRQRAAGGDSSLAAILMLSMLSR